MDAARSSEVRMPFNLVKLRNVWFTLSGVVILVGLVSLFTKGLNLGTDFKGGAEITYTPSVALPAEGAERGALMDRIATTLGLGSGAVKIIDTGQGQDLLIRVSALDTEQLETQKKDILDGLTADFSAELGELTESRDATFIGPVIGKELRSRAVWMLIMGLGAILLWVRQRYNTRMAVVGIGALAHDALIMVGMTALGGWEVNSPFIAALLTVVGFSINDSVVIFDRIRENQQTRAVRSDDFGDTVNYALWQTMARSINTTFTVIIVLTTLLLFGGATIHEFAVSLLIGMVAGSYSSIFPAGGVIAIWEEKARKAKGAAARARSGMPSPRIERRKPETASAAVETANGAPSLEDSLAADAATGGTKPRAQVAKRVRSAELKGGKSKKRH